MISSTNNFVCPVLIPYLVWKAGTAWQLSVSQVNRIIMSAVTSAMLCLEGTNLQIPEQNISSSSTEVFEVLLLNPGFFNIILTLITCWTVASYCRVHEHLSLMVTFLYCIWQLTTAVFEPLFAQEFVLPNSLDKYSHVKGCPFCLSVIHSTPCCLYPV